MKALCRTISLLALAGMASGCIVPSDRLSFPAAPVRSSSQGRWYDVKGTGRADFALLADENGRLTTLAYDDDGEQRFDRQYRLADYRNEDVPHLIIILDSIPYQAVGQRWDGGDFRWFSPPQKLIAPFPSMTEPTLEQMFQGPPLPGLSDRHHDRQANTTRDLIWARVWGYQHPWERRLDYEADYARVGSAYLWPRPWCRAEMAQIKRTVDRSDKRVVVAYVSSTSGMLSRGGQAGLSESLDELQRLCLQLLYERRGALKISVLADHGHNLMASQFVDLEQILGAAGFHCVEHLRGRRDVALELNGLVTYAGLHTSQPTAVAEALAARKEVELAMYLQGDQVIVRDARGAAAIVCGGGKVGYKPLTADVLGYSGVVQGLAAQGKVDAAGLVCDEDWLAATCDHRWPDAPRRIWDAFHGLAVNTPDLMVTLHDGYCAGAASLRRFIEMASTHGGLNQANSAAFVLSMTGRATRPLRSRDVLRTLEPSWFSVVP